MELAAIIAIVLLDYVDFALIVALLLINSTIGMCHTNKWCYYAVHLLKQYFFSVLGRIFERQCYSRPSKTTDAHM